eukprot:3373193-Rhodomonas_salina.1
MHLLCAVRCFLQRFCVMRDRLARCCPSHLCKRVWERRPYFLCPNWYRRIITGRLLRRQCCRTSHSVGAGSDPIGCVCLSKVCTYPCQVQFASAVVPDRIPPLSHNCIPPLLNPQPSTRKSRPASLIPQLSTFKAGSTVWVPDCILQAESTCKKPQSQYNLYQTNTISVQFVPGM